MTTEMSPAVIHALAIGNLPDFQWEIHDDLCDCTYQRIGMWKNPYLAEQHEIRLCCVWEKLGTMFPDFVRDIPAYWDGNEKQWLTEPMEWNGETEMPKALWYRHLARKEGITVAEARAKYADRDDERPRGVQRPVVEQEPEFDPIAGLMLLVADLTRKVEALEAR